MREGIAQRSSEEEEVRSGREYSYVCKSDTLSEGFIFGEDKGALDVVHKGRSCVCELGIYTTQMSEMAACLVFQCLVAMPCAQLALKDCEWKTIPNCLSRKREGERESDSQVKVISLHILFAS